MNIADYIHDAMNDQTLTEMRLIYTDKLTEAINALRLMHKALEDIVHANPASGHLECPQTKIARRALGDVGSPVLTHEKGWGL